MAQSLAKNLIHLIYSTKNRTPWLTSAIRPNLFAYKTGILTQWQCQTLTIGGVEDHVHLLFSLSKNHSLVKIVEEVKKGSSKWIKTQGPTFQSFAWQGGYGAFSVSESNADAVRKYIERQVEHHKKQSFLDELRAFLAKHKIDFDERYLWD